MEAPKAETVVASFHSPDDTASGPTSVALVCQKVYPEMYPPPSLDYSRSRRLQSIALHSSKHARLNY